MNYINEEYIEEYIRSILPENNFYLKAMEQYAEENHIPIIQPEVAQLLKVLLKMKNPRSILEVGTAIGYSALIMAEATSPQCNITTIERRQDMIQLAENNISNTEYKNRIKILQGEAEEILPTLESKFDFIFLDAAKGQYLEFFKYCISFLQPEGIIVSDNVLYKGMVATDKLVVRRKKTIVKRLRQFLHHINHIDGYISCVIPIGDGVAITHREDDIFE
ncbi:O-methyltransferase [Tissierella sp. MSJ-40]|uniref:tRNA 5-hydroxyuridine methyltransferase n=1 Tax=Tissierella simiarum TaxID=2841534 RepID=A0ABS6EBC1_9FIRM|nr:O-methyltransferase [Tissierella simiarum]MBU5440223.1 O-methyltransferase [Tissierella simiarum]